MNEATAKTKWCPMVRDIDVKLGEHPGVHIAGAFCKGSDCMMFRERRSKDGLPTGSYYCGLGGQP